MSFTLNSFRKLRRLISLLCLFAVLVPILSMYADAGVCRLKV